MDNTDTKGKIIVIDGGANVGKATQADMLTNRLQNEGREVGKLDFPRYHQHTFGKLVQECLSDVHTPMFDLPPKVAATLYAADRFEAKTELNTWLAEGRIIILDRYVSANMLHQGVKIEHIDEREEFFRWVEHVEYTIFGIPKPDMVVYLDIPPQKSEKLLEYVENLGVKVTTPKDQAEMHQAKVSECAHYLSALHPEWHAVQCLQTDGELRDREDIHEEVYKIISTRLGV